MSPRQEILNDSSVVESAERRRLVSFILLGDCLARGAAPSIVEGYDHIWRSAGRRMAIDFVSYGTPFFWKNVSRCLAGADRNGRSFAQIANFLLRTGFDSYFAWLPNGTSFLLDAEDADVVLPRLGLRFPSVGRSVVLQRLDSKQIGIKLGNERIDLDLEHVDSAFRLPTIDIPGLDAKLLMVKDPTLFEESYIDKVVPEARNGGVLAKMIAKSLEMIEAADPALASRLTGMVRWYVPISTPGPSTHNSLSVKGLRGVIFLSEAYEDIRIAEAIVHEYYHNELYLFQEGEAVHQQVPNEFFYSPWRPDARPLDGLFHAVYVFGGVAHFLARAEQLPALADYVEFLRNRRAEVVAQLRIGLYQVPSNRLTERGKQIIQLVEAEVQRHEVELGRLHGRLPQPLAEHLARWKVTHPGLVHRILMPEGVEV